MTEDKLVRGGMKTIRTKYGEILDVSIHMDELPELYKLHKDFNAGKASEDKAEWVHIQILTSRAGKPYLKFNDYGLQGNKKPAAPAAPETKTDEADNELPF